jgi:transposase
VAGRWRARLSGSRGTALLLRLASHRTELFRDEDFADLYCSDNGRPSVPPSLLATALLLQAYEGVSDEEAKARADFDLRWKVALGVGLQERPFAKSTLQLFRARLILHEQVRTVFAQSLVFARRIGYLRTRKLKVVLDTTYVLGRGALKDTYNLLADGIARLVGALAAREPTPSRKGGRMTTASGATLARL